jgi:acyl carrier protein
MTERRTLEQQIAGWFLEKLNVEIPSPETDLFESGVLDSLAFVELMLYVEQAFAITITLELVQIDSFRSISRIVTFVRDQCGESMTVVETRERMTA